MIRMKKRGIEAEVGRFRSISVRLTAFALVISILPLIFVSMLLLGQMDEMTERELAQSYRWLVSENIGNVQDKLRMYSDCLEYISRSSTIQEALRERNGNSYTLGGEITEEIFKMVPMENSSEVYNCLVYAVGPAKVYGTNAKVLTDIDRAMWQEDGWQGGSECFIDTLWSGEKMLSMVKEIRYVDVDAFRTETIGFVRLDLYLEGLFRPVGGQKNYQIVIFDEADACIYASEDGLEQMLDSLRGPDAEGEDGVRSIGTYAALESEISGYGLNLLYLFDNNELIEQKSLIRKSLYPTALAIFLAVILIARLYFAGFSRRVGQLLEKFRIAGSGDLSPTPPIRGDDEIAVLDLRFGQMLRDVDAMNRRNEEQKNIIREARYRNLQLQINPHFLYNTLETISAIGAMHGVMQVCDLCEKLGDIFRYSLGKNEGKYTTVAKELRQIRNYIFIQQVRHKFEVVYSVDVDADEVYMLRFLLQPIVENAVQHGLLKAGKTGTLEVSVCRKDGDLEICIGDDGVGMSEKELEDLRRRLQQGADQRENVANIGVWNISQRIRLSHGEPYGVSVQSKPGMGSMFILRLPMITKGMIEDDEIPASDR